MNPLNEDFERWEVNPPPELFGDTIWRLPAYRISRYLALQVRTDAGRISRLEPTTAEQLVRAVDSIGINISEGYGRLSGRERARFFEYALGSAREARDWYARVGPCLPEGLALQRAYLLTRAIKILTVAIPRERAGSSERRIRDAQVPTGVERKVMGNPSKDLGEEKR